MNDTHDELSDDQLEAAAGGLAPSTFDAPRFDDAPLKPGPGVVICTVAPPTLAEPKPTKSASL